MRSDRSPVNPGCGSIPVFIRYLLGVSWGTDIAVIATVTLLILLVLFVPFIPVLRDIPRWFDVYRFIWRKYYSKYDLR